MCKAPLISGFTPSSGNVGGALLVNGTYLSGVTAVTIGGVTAASFNVNPLGTELKVVIPAGAQTGPIVVVTPAGSAATTNSFVIAPLPTRFGLIRLRFSTVKGYRFNVQSNPGAALEVQASSDLAHWSSVITASNPSGSIVLIDPGATNFAHRFYRAVSR